MKRKRIVVEKKRCQMKNELPVTNCAYKKNCQSKKNCCVSVLGDGCVRGEGNLRISCNKVYASNCLFPIMST